MDVRVKVKSQVSNSLKFSYKETEEKLKILSNGMFAPYEVEEATTFRGVSHIRLKNGDIFTVNSSRATVSFDEGKTWTTPRMIARYKDYIQPEEIIMIQVNGLVIAILLNLIREY